MKLSPRTELFITLPFVLVVTLVLFAARAEGVAFNGFVLNKWTILAFYCVAVAELVHIYVKGKSCESNLDASETKDQSSS